VKKEMKMPSWYHRIVGNTKEQPINQCDGCQADLPLDANNNHYEPQKTAFAYRNVFRCTKERYVK